VTANISTPLRAEDQIANILAVIGQPARIQILVILGTEEACVCHLEAVMGMRQASISQHLMLLRKAGLVTTQREGRNIFYHLANPGVNDLLRQAAELAGLDPVELQRLTLRPVPGCCCPHCNPALDPSLACKKSPSTQS